MKNTKYTFVIFILMIMVGCTTITKGDFSFSTTQNVEVEMTKNGEDIVNIKVKSVSTGKKEFIQGLIEGLK